MEHGLPKERRRDPTANVLGYVKQAIQRQDDLRRAERRHIREILDIRAAYSAELRTSESDRINAIRTVDVDAVGRASAVSDARATTLAAQVAVSAETLRTQVAAAATAAATSLAAALEPIQKDIADLRRVQYEAQGQQIQQVDQRAHRSESRETSTIAVLYGGWVIGFAGFVTSIYFAVHK